MRWVMTGVVLCALASSAEALEVWLASSENCNSCALYERVAQQRGYGSALRYADGGNSRIPILAIGKNVLAQDMLAQLPPGEGPDSPNWDVTLTVLVVDAGRVLAAGKIAESADNSELQQPRAVMFPPAAPADGDAALRRPESVQRILPEPLEPRVLRRRGARQTAEAHTCEARRSRIARTRSARAAQRRAVGLRRHAARERAVHPDAHGGDSRGARHAEARLAALRHAVRPRPRRGRQRHELHRGRPHAIQTRGHSIRLRGRRARG